MDVGPATFSSYCSRAVWACSATLHCTYTSLHGQINGMAKSMLAMNMHPHAVYALYIGAPRQKHGHQPYEYSASKGAEHTPPLLPGLMMVTWSRSTHRAMGGHWLPWPNDCMKNIGQGLVGSTPVTRAQQSETNRVHVLSENRCCWAASHRTDFRYERRAPPHVLNMGQQHCVWLFHIFS